MPWYTCTFLTWWTALVNVFSWVVRYVPHSLAKFMWNPLKCVKHIQLEWRTNHLRIGLNNFNLWHLIHVTFLGGLWHFLKFVWKWPRLQSVTLTGSTSTTAFNNCHLQMLLYFRPRVCKHYASCTLFRAHFIKSSWHNYDHYYTQTSRIYNLMPHLHSQIH